MLYAYGATVVEIVRRKEFGESGVDGKAMRCSTELPVSPVLLPACPEHLGSHGKTFVRLTECPSVLPWFI